MEFTSASQKLFSIASEVVKVITSDKDRWVAEMMKNELNMIREEISPFKKGLVTFLAFNFVGLVPLMTYLLSYFGESSGENTFLLSCVFTMIAFLLVGWLRAYVTQTNKIKGILETVLLGGAAATIAYVVGDLLEKVF